MIVAFREYGRAEMNALSDSGGCTVGCRENEKKSEQYEELERIFIVGRQFDDVIVFKLVTLSFFRVKFCNIYLSIYLSIYPIRWVSAI